MRMTLGKGSYPGLCGHKHSDAPMFMRMRVSVLCNITSSRISQELCLSFQRQETPGLTLAIRRSKKFVNTHLQRRVPYTSSTIEQSKRRLAETREIFEGPTDCLTDAN